MVQQRSPRVAKKLRANTTPHERMLWRALKKFRYTARTSGGKRRSAPTCVDFFCPAKAYHRADGGHHNVEETARRDRERQLWLEQEGYRIIRFWNSEITGDPTAVLDRIYVELYGSREAEVAPLKHLRRR